MQNYEHVPLSPVTPVKWLTVGILTFMASTAVSRAVAAMLTCCL